MSSVNQRYRAVAAKLDRTPRRILHFVFLATNPRPLKVVPAPYPGFDRAPG